MRKEPGKRVRYAVVGAGHIAQAAILPAFRNASENSELVAIVSGEREKREAIAKGYGVKFTGDYDDLEQVIDAAKVDAVYITLPNSLHRSFTERAAKRRVHVLCEKPLAATVEDCEAMIRTCKEHGVLLMTAYRLHFEEANLRAIERIERGEIGEPRLISAVFTQQVRAGDVRTKYELAGGALFDLGVYCINAARYLFRDEPEEVVAMITRGSDERFREPIDEATSATLRFPRGRLAQFSVSLGAASTSSYRVIGTRGDLRVEPAYDYAGPLEHHLTVDGKSAHTTFAKRDQFGPELSHFSRAILAQTEPGPSGEEGLFDVRIVRAVLQSAEEGRAVRLLPYLRSHRPDIRQLVTMPAVAARVPVEAAPPTQGER